MQSTKKNSYWGRRLWIYPAVFMLIFYVYPLGMILQRSFGATSLVKTWEAVEKTARFAFQSAAGQAALSTILTLLVGFPAAFVFSRYRFTGRGLLRILVTLPFILPTVVAAAGFNALLGPQGWLNLLLMRLLNSSQPPLVILNTLGVVVLAHVFYNVSIIIRVVSAALEQLDPRLEQSAAVLGANPIRRFTHVLLPLLTPALLSAILLVFLFNFTSFGVILLLGGGSVTTPEVEIYIQTTQFLNLPAAAFITVLQFMCTLTLTWLLSRIGPKWVVPMMPRTVNPSARIPKSWGEKIFFCFVVLALITISVLPLVALVLRAFFQWNPQQTGILPQLRFSVGGFTNLFINSRQSFFFVPPAQAIRNSLLFAAVSAIISVSLGLAATYSIVRYKKSHAWLEHVLMLPLGTSAVTLGLGYLTAFSGMLRGTQFSVLLIPLVHALIGLPFVMRAVRPALESIPASVLQAGSVLGASARDVWKRVEFPIIRRALGAGAVFAFTISLGEFGAAIFLTRPEWPTITTAIFRFLNQPGEINYSQALAMAVILLFICFLAVLLIDQLQEGR